MKTLSREQLDSGRSDAQGHLGTGDVLLRVLEIVKESRFIPSDSLVHVRSGVREPFYLPALSSKKTMKIGSNCGAREAGVALSARACSRGRRGQECGRSAERQECGKSAAQLLQACSKTGARGEEGGEGGLARTSRGGCLAMVATSVMMFRGQRLAHKGAGSMLSASTVPLAPPLAATGLHYHRSISRHPAYASNINRRCYHTCLCSARQIREYGIERSGS